MQTRRIRYVDHKLVVSTDVAGHQRFSRRQCTFLLSKTKTKMPPGTPIAVLCDNSRDVDRIPSDLNDFRLHANPAGDA